MDTHAAVTPDQAFLNENRQNEVYATHITFFIIMMIIVPCRWASCRLVGKPLSWDDGLAYFAAFNTIGVFIGSMLWLKFGLGMHVAVVAQQDPKNLERFFQTIVANEMLYTTALASARLSLIAFLYQIFGVSSMRYFLHGFAILVVAWAISTVNTPYFFVGISSLAYFWDGTMQNCIDLSKFYVGVAVGGIITDFGLMIVPLPYIWKLKVPLYHKILIAAMLVFGSFACFVTVIRLSKIITVDLTDPTWGTVDLMIWTGIEVYSDMLLPPYLETTDQISSEENGFSGHRFFLTHTQQLNTSICHRKNVELKISSGLDTLWTKEPSRSKRRRDLNRGFGDD
ncbi:hypothetical protein NM208_g3409 [Fusarium decemcellulare]|uniref:Uncharacterized protein n=1 Tax=Fusarium decemcellulare TaxID=57161 RepID=A0ACC1SP55_9HYPO|nr:hypothetical protein NM208_g3409 [Fusarium decemcellulare]